MKNRIREYREARGWSQAELARAIGVQPAAISRYEKEDQRVNLPLLAKLAEALKVEPTTLISDEARPDVRMIAFANEQAAIWVDTQAFFPGGDITPSALRVKDDTMRPTLATGDIVIFDRLGDGRDRTYIVDGAGLWVFRNDDLLHVRRVLVDPLGGGYVVTADDPAYSTHRPPRPKLYAEGKVLWIIRQAH